MEQLRVGSLPQAHRADATKKEVSTRGIAAHEGTNRAVVPDYTWVTYSAAGWLSRKAAPPYDGLPLGWRELPLGEFRHRPALSACRNTAARSASTR